MKREDKVISLELAKKLDKLGVEAESEWWWNNSFDAIHNNPSWIGKKEEWHSTNKWEQSRIEDNQYPAYDTAELWEFMPADIMLGKFIGEYFCWKAHKHDCRAVNKEIVDFYLAELLGAMLVWLIENDYIKAGEL